MPATRACALSGTALDTMGSCKGTSGGRDEAIISRCAARAVASKAADPEPWRCLEMQLWAQINSAVSTFGRRCLGLTGAAAGAVVSASGRYTVWHGEDGYGLRGDAALHDLQSSLAGVPLVPRPAHHPALCKGTFSFAA